MRPIAQIPSAPLRRRLATPSSGTCYRAAGAEHEDGISAHRFGCVVTGGERPLTTLLP